MKRTKTIMQGDAKVPVMHHIAELRKVLMVCVIALLVASTLAYVFFDPLLALFQAPLNQKLYYTSPAGGFSFAVKLCLTAGLVVSVPVLVNRIFHFVKPAVPRHFHRSFAWYSFFSVMLAVLGVLFGYFISLPGALYFLTNFKSDQIQALITVDSYFTFFSAYLVGYAILFQTPIIMLFINRVKPLDPGTTIKYEKYVIGGSFIVAAVLTPTPDPWNQTLMAIPIILLYQVGIFLVWWANKHTKPEWKHLEKGALKAKIPAHLQSMPAEPVAAVAKVQPETTVITTRLTDQTKNMTPQIAPKPAPGFDIIVQT